MFRLSRTSATAWTAGGGGDRWIVLWVDRGGGTRFPPQWTSPSQLR